MKPLFNSVVFSCVEMSWQGGGGGGRKKPHRNEKEWGKGGKRHTKGKHGGSEGESGVSVENTKLLSDGEQMSDCHCACIFSFRHGLGEARRQWAPCGCQNRARSAKFKQKKKIPWQQINDLKSETRPTSRGWS